MNKLKNKDLYFIFQTLETGGAEKSILEIASLLSTKNYNVNILFFKKNNDLSNQIPKNVNKIYLKSPSWISLFSKLLILNLTCKKNSLFFTALDIPIIITLFSNLIFLKRNKTIILIRCAIEGSFECENFIKILIIKFCQKFLYSRTDFCISNSKYAFKECYRKKIVDHSKLIYIPNIVDLEKYKYLASENISHLKQFKPYIICLGNIHERKNYSQAINAFYEVQKVYQSLKLIIVGAIHSKKEFGHLNILINKLNLKSKVIFTGFIQNPLPIINESELLLHTSISEGFPNAVIQSICLKKSVIITTKHGDGGAICNEFNWCEYLPTKDSKLLAKTIMQYVKSNKSDERSIQRLNEFSKNKVITAYERIIKKALN